MGDGCNSRSVLRDGGGDGVRGERGVAGISQIVRGDDVAAITSVGNGADKCRHSSHGASSRCAGAGGEASCARNAPRNICQSRTWRNGARGSSHSHGVGEGGAKASSTTTGENHSCWRDLSDHNNAG